MTVKRGEIYWVEFDPVKGSEQGGLRPALVVQNDLGNRFSPTTVVAAITRTIPPQSYPFIVIIEPEESGLPTRSAINCAQIATWGLAKAFENRTAAQMRFAPLPGSGYTARHEHSTIKTTERRIPRIPAPAPPARAGDH